MPYRSFDFERIYNEFLSCYSTREEAEREYYSWLHALSLDESRMYSEARESFLWRKEDLQFVKEDAEAKYYEVEVGFPTKSMNGNVYRKRDLVAAALTLKGKHPSLNHKSEFWFSPRNPRNRWGNIEIVDGRFHEGICKALVRVPRTAICPICNGKPMTELIDSKRIYNVSLEGDCAGGQCGDGTCEGFYFTDPPFTFLTTDVLPGIPMTRIKPLESYMPASHNSQSSINRGKENKILKIKPKIVEDTVQKIPLDPESPAPSVNTRSLVDTNFQGQWGTPITSDNKLYSHTSSSGNVNVAVGTSPGDHVMRSNTGQLEAVAEPFADYTDFADCVAKNQDKEDPEAYCASIKQQVEAKRREDNAPDRDVIAPMTGPVDDTTVSPRPEDTTEGPKKSKPPEFDVDQPADAPSSLPSQEKPEKEAGEEPPKATVGVKVGDAPVEQAEEPCPDGYHRNEEGECVPDEEIEEKVRRFKAEDKARSMEEQALLWEQRYRKLDREHVKLQGKSHTLEQALKRQENRADEAIRQLRNQEVTTGEWHKKWEREVALREEYKNQVETYQEENKRLSEKYNKSLDINLKLSKDVTKANEDYLEVARLKENLEEALRRSKKFSKKIIKLKA